MVDYVTTKQAAELVGCSGALIRKWIRAGRIDAEKVDGAWRIPASAIEGVQVVRTGSDDAGRERYADDGGGSHRPQGGQTALLVRLEASERLVAAHEATIEDLRTALRTFAEMQERIPVEPTPQLAPASWWSRLFRRNPVQRVAV